MDDATSREPASVDRLTARSFTFTFTFTFIFVFG
jgi:hypothetical protein